VLGRNREEVAEHRPLLVGEAGRYGIGGSGDGLAVVDPDVSALR
jgi:hypothetical protein